MVNIQKILTEYLDHKFNSSDSKFWDREIGTYHASDLGRCIRQIFYEFELGRRESPDSYPHFYLGNLIENFVEKALAHHYGADNIKNSFRIKLRFGDFDVVGQTDPVLLNANLKPEKLFEVKSTKRVEFKRDEPSGHHVMQVHPYMKALNLKSCTIIYVQKTDLTIVSHNVPFEGAVLRRGIERIGRLHRALNRNEAPEPTPFESWECRFCPYRKECPGGDWSAGRKLTSPKSG